MAESEIAAPIGSSEQENGVAKEPADGVNPNTDIPLSEEKKGSPVKLKKLSLAGAELYFANNPDRLQRATSKLKEQCLLPDLDGSMIKLYVLTEIDHWNHDRERVVLLCENSVLSVNYSFITEKWTELTRINVKCISAIQFGEESYPKYTLQYPRPTKCLRITYQRLSGPATTAEKWNPFAKHLPWCNLTSHPLANKIQGSTDIYNIEDFHKDLLQVLNSYRDSHPDAPHTVECTEGPLEMNIRLGLSSYVVNQSHLAFAKDRGGVHF